jgi:hypothetical protein
MPTTTRAAAAVAVLAATALTALTGCGAVNKALDCARTAATIADDVQDLQNTVGNAGSSPQAAVSALDRIDQDLKSLGDKTGDADVGKAVSNLQQAVENARTAADKGTVPDATPVGDAAAELTKVCTP